MVVGLAVFVVVLSVVVSSTVVVELVVPGGLVSVFGGIVTVVVALSVVLSVVSWVVSRGFSGVSVLISVVSGLVVEDPKKVFFFCDCTHVTSYCVSDIDV